MADDFSTAAQKLVSSGKLDQHKQELEKIVSSDDGKNVRRIMEENGIEDAVKKGDMNAVRSAVGNILNTPEGARLAKQISELFK
jgi:hypothetical protein